MNKTKIDQDKIRDIAIKCVDEMVNQGIIKDCIDTDDSTEFDIQDIIVDTLLKEKLFKNKCDESLNRSRELLYFINWRLKDVEKHSALADIEALDMIKDSLCVECDSYLDYSELKDSMCSKCGENLNT